MKLLKRFIVITLILSIISISIISTSAFVRAEDSLASVENWCQWLDPWANESAYGNTGTGYDIANNCCSYYSVAYMLVKMGIYDPKKGDNAGTFFKAMREKGCIDGDSNWLCHFKDVPKVYPEVEFVDSGSDDGRWAEATGSWDSCKAWYKEKYNEGYYICLCFTSAASNGHFVFIDGFTEDGKTSVGDCGYEGGTVLEDLHSSISASSCFLFKYKKPCNEQPSIYDGTALRTGTDNDLTSEEQSQYDSIVSEWQLMGMPEKSKIYEKAEAVIQEIGKIKNMGSRENLDIEHTQSLISIKESMEAQKMTAEKIMSIICSLVGLLMEVYVLLLLLAFFFDRFNNFLDASVVSILSFGKLNVLSKYEMQMVTEKEKAEKGYISYTNFFIKILVISLIGGLLLSGVLLKGIFFIIRKIV